MITKQLPPSACGSQPPRGQALVDPISLSDAADIKEAFRIFDVNGTGFITLREAEIALRALDLTYTAADLAALAGTANPGQSSDPSGAGGPGYLVSEKNFSNFAYNQFALRPKYERHRLLFNLFDIGQKGYITLEDLRQKVVELGEGPNISDMELQAMISEAEPEEEWKVTLPEFSRILTKAEHIQKHRLRQTAGEDAQSLMQQLICIDRQKGGAGI